MQNALIGALEVVINNQYPSQMFANKQVKSDNCILNLSVTIFMI